jgi:hypothetical protein
MSTSRCQIPPYVAGLTPLVIRENLVHMLYVRDSAAVCLRRLARLGPAPLGDLPYPETRRIARGRAAMMVIMRNGEENVSL